MNHTTRAQRINKRLDAIWERSLKLKRQAELMAFADHVYAASEPIREDTMTAQDRKEQLRSPIEPDYEPEQAYGSADDFRRHQQYGGTREDY